MYLVLVSFVKNILQLFEPKQVEKVNFFFECKCVVVDKTQKMIFCLCLLENNSRQQKQQNRTSNNIAKIIEIDSGNDDFLPFGINISQLRVYQRLCSLVGGSAICKNRYFFLKDETQIEYFI